MSGRLREALGREAVVEIPAKMVFEDFAEFGWREYGHC
jgi:hypothetical protein